MSEDNAPTADIPRSNESEGVETIEVYKSIMGKVQEVAQALKIDINEDPHGFKAVVLNPQQTFIGIEVSDIDNDTNNPEYLERYVEISLPDNTGIKVNIRYAPKPNTEGNVYEIVEPSSILIKPREDTFVSVDSKSGQVYRNEEKVESSILTEANHSVLSKITGSIVNPYEVMYGDLSDADLIKEYLASQEGIVVVDPNSKRVVRLLDEKKDYNHQIGRVTTPAIVWDYDEILKEAKENLRLNLWEKSFGTLASRLQQKRSKQKLPT